MRRALFAASLLATTLLAGMPAVAQFTIDKELGPGLTYRNGKIVPQFGTTAGTVADGGAAKDAADAATAAQQAGDASQVITRTLLPTVGADGSLHVLDANGQDHVYAPVGGLGAIPAASSASIVHSASASGSAITSATGVLYDGAGHALTLVGAAGALQVAINGVVDTATSAVAQALWQAGQFYWQSGTTWHTEPVTGGAGAVVADPRYQAASADGTSVTAAGTSLYDGFGHTMSLVTSASVGLQVSVNGTVDTSSRNVTQLVWISGKFFYLNNLAQWFAEPVTGGPGVATSNPLPSNAPVTAVSAAGSAVTLNAPGSLAATKNGSTFSWINQDFATATGGGAGNLSISDPFHSNVHNLRMLAATLPATSATYTALVNNPMVGSIYNGGMFLSQADGSKITTLESIYGNTTGSVIKVYSYATPQGGAESQLASIQEGFANTNTTFFMRIVYDAGAGTYSFLVSATGLQASWILVSTQSAASVGSPTRIGFYSDADDQGGYMSGNPGILNVASFQPTAGANPQAAASGGDSTANFLLTVNNPLTDIPPVIAALTGPGDGLVMQAGSSNVLNMVFGSAQANANITDEATLRKYVYMNYLEGDLSGTIGSPMDTGQNGNGTFAAVGRHYPLGDPNSTTPVFSDGLHMKAFCTVNHTNCAPGSVFGGLIRLTPAIRAGMTVKFRYKMATGYHSWTSKWFFTGEQRTPGPGGNPWQSNLYDEGVSGNNFEIDACDCYNRHDDNNNAGEGNVLDYGTPNIYGVAWPTGNSPRYTYLANDGSFAVAHPNAGPPFIAFPNLNWAHSFHDLVMNWRNDGTNLIDMYVDGREVMQSYFDYADTVMKNQFGQPLGLNLIVQNQAIPAFSDGTNYNNAGILDNDGTLPGTDEVANPGGWTDVIQEISIWQGNVANPDSHR